MNPAQLLEHFNRISEAPDAVARLRRFILDLAVRGKLVVQNQGDEPAAELLKRIQAEKARLVNEGKIKKQAPLPFVEVGDEPFPLPANWMWCHLGEIGDWGSGSTPPRGNSEYYGGEVTWLKSGELGDSLALSGSDERVSKLALEKCSFRLNQPDDVLIAMYGATIGKLAILAEPAVTNQAVCGCTPFKGVFNKYLFLFLLSRREDFHDQSEGGAQPNISKAKIVSSPFTLPPLAEQHRIVAKVDELMALCDQLEAAKNEREARRDQLVAASLHRIGTAPVVAGEAATEAQSATPLRDAARFHLDHLPRLTIRPEHIKQLRQTILNLAVLGRLVPQDPNDEPAGRVLERIDRAPKRVMRTRAIDDGEDELPTELEPLFELPVGWEWAQFRRLPIQVSVGIDRGRSMQGPDKAFRYFKMNNILNSGGIDLSDLTRIDATSNEVEAFALADGDFLFNTRNSRELVGKTCVFRPLSSDPILYNNNILRVKFIDGFSPDLLDYWFRSPEGNTELEKLKSNTTNVCAIYQGKLSGFPCPIPPLAEQHRIVAKVDELMALCDQLEAQLTAAQTDSRRLLEAVLHESLAKVA